VGAVEREECRRLGDFCPILFEWYKYTGVIANIIASIQLESAAAKPVPKPHYGVLIGLLNRCSRLMLANVALSHRGLFGETTAIVDRCIFESAVKVLWLSRQEAEAGFTCYIGEGLKVVPCLMAVQVKHTSLSNRRVGPQPVRDLLGVVQTHGFNVGLLVTNTTFTPDARWVADQRPMLLRLRDIEDLLRWLRDKCLQKQEWRDLPREIELCPGITIELPG